MKKTTGKPYNVQRELRNMRKKVADLSEELTELGEDCSTFSEQLDDINTMLYDVKEMIEDKLIMHMPTSPAEALSALERRYYRMQKEDRQAWEAMMVAWTGAAELRALLRRAPRKIRDHFIGVLQTYTSDDSVWHGPEDPPLRPDEEIVEAIKLEWNRATELRDLVSRADGFIRERFVALVCVDSNSYAHSLVVEHLRRGLKPLV